MGGKGGAMNLSQEQVKNLVDKMGPMGGGNASGNTPINATPGGGSFYNDLYGGGVDPSLYSDPNLGGGESPRPSVESFKAKEAIDMIGTPDPIVPIYNTQDPAVTPAPMPMPMPMPNVMAKRGPKRMRFAGGVVNLQGGGIASVDPRNMPMQDPLSMGNEQPPLMEEAELMEVVRQVAQAFSQGIPVNELPPELAQKIAMAVQLFGEQTVMSLISEQTQAQQPQQPQPQPQSQQPQQPQQPQPMASPEFPQGPPVKYDFQEGGATPQSPEMQLIEQTISAVLGQMPQDQADIIINQFISEFGQEAFEMLREQALQSVVPNAQTEGVIRGQGGGMDDMVNGMIGAEQPVAVSPGEYIVPADVVSGLGDGSTDGGVEELDGMLDRVRQTRTGTMQQPAPMNTGGVLPA